MSVWEDANVSTEVFNFKETLNQWINKLNEEESGRVLFLPESRLDIMNLSFEELREDNEIKRFMKYNDIDCVSSILFVWIIEFNKFLLPKEKKIVTELLV